MIESVGFDNGCEDRVDDVEDDANTKGGDDYNYAEYKDIDWLIDIDEDDKKESDECERR